MYNLNLIIFIVLSLAVWRASKMLTNEKGPYNIIERFRNKIINEPWSPLFCFKCTTIWLGFLFASILQLHIEHFLLAWFASSGAALLIDVVYEGILANMPDEVSGEER